MLTTQSTVRFINTMLAALLAGTSFGIWVGFNPKNYTASTYLEQQQQLVQALNTLMVSMVILTTLVSILSAYLQRQHKPVFIALLLAAAFFAACIFISRFGNLPIQTEMLTWELKSLPENWMDLRDKWWNLHIMRTIAELLGLGLVVLTNVSNRTTSLAGA